MYSCIVLKQLDPIKNTERHLRDPTLEPANVLIRHEKVMMILMLFDDDDGSNDAADVDWYDDNDDKFKHQCNQLIMIARIKANGSTGFCRI